MRFQVNKNCQYRELIVRDHGAQMESGLLNEDERREMAEILRDAADELMRGLEEQ